MKLNEELEARAAKIQTDPLRFRREKVDPCLPACKDFHHKQAVQNAKLFGGSLCFDVFIDGEDCRWRIRAHGPNLEGIWNLGPEGGPGTNGLGPGVRLFQIRVRRVAKPKRRLALSSQ